MRMRNLKNAEEARRNYLKALKNFPKATKTNQFNVTKCSTSQWVSEDQWGNESETPYKLSSPKSRWTRFAKSATMTLKSLRSPNFRSSKMKLRDETTGLWCEDSIDLKDTKNNFWAKSDRARMTATHGRLTKSTVDRHRSARLTATVCSTHLPRSCHLCREVLASKALTPIAIRGAKRCEGNIQLSARELLERQALTTQAPRSSSPAYRGTGFQPHGLLSTDLAYLNLNRYVQ